MQPSTRVRLNRKASTATALMRAPQEPPQQLRHSHRPTSTPHHKQDAQPAATPAPKNEPKRSPGWSPDRSCAKRASRGYKNQIQIHTYTHPTLVRVCCEGAKLAGARAGIHEAYPRLDKLSASTWPQPSITPAATHASSAIRRRISHTYQHTAKHHTSQLKTHKPTPHMPTCQHRTTSPKSHTPTPSEAPYPAPAQHPTQPLTKHLPNR